MKKVLVLFLAMVLLVSVLPLSALAEAAAEPVHVIMLDPYYGDASGERVTRWFTTTSWSTPV